MSLKNIIGQNAHWQVNKRIAKEVGVESALLLSEFIDCYDYYEANNQLVTYDNELYFYETSDRIEENTTLGYKTQKRCIDILVEKEFVKTKLKGIPAKLHFTICEDKIWQMLKTSIAKTVKLESPKGENIINNRILINDNKECDKSENHTHDSNSNFKTNTLNKNTTSVSNSTKGAVAVGGENEENDTYVPNFLKPTQKVFKFYISRQFNEEIIGFDSVMSFMNQHFEISLKTLSFNYDKFMPQIVKDFEKLNTGKIWKNKEDLRSHFSNYCHKWTPKANTVEPIRKRKMITEND